MQISCPECHAKYSVKDELFQNTTRKLRCAKCKHVWAPGEATKEKPVAETSKSKPKSEKTTRFTDNAKKRKINYPWLAFGLVIILLVAGAVFGRHAIVKAWPASARFYDLIQMPIDVIGAGLDFEEIKANRILDNDRLVLLLKGKIVNKTDRVRSVPKFIQAVSLNAYNDPIEKWQFEAPEAELGPGESIEFQSVLKDINGFASNLVVRFTDGLEKKDQKPQAIKAAPHQADEMKEPKPTVDKHH